MSRWMREEKLSWMGDNGPLNRAGVCLHLVIRGAAVGEGGGRADASGLLPQAGSRGAPDGIRAPPLSPTSEKMMSADLPGRRSLLRPVATATAPFSRRGGNGRLNARAFRLENRSRLALQRERALSSSGVKPAGRLVRQKLSFLIFRFIDVV